MMPLFLTLVDLLILELVLFRTLLPLLLHLVASPFLFARATGQLHVNLLGLLPAALLLLLLLLGLRSSFLRVGAW